MQKGAKNKKQFSQGVMPFCKKADFFVVKKGFNIR